MKVQNMHDHLYGEGYYEVLEVVDLEETTVHHHYYKADEDTYEREDN